MREMKDSGIEWIGAIPAAWGVHRIASHFQEIKEKNTANAYSNALQFKMGKLLQSLKNGTKTRLTRHILRIRLCTPIPL